MLDAECDEKCLRAQGAAWWAAVTSWQAAACWPGRLSPESDRIDVTLSRARITTTRVGVGRIEFGSGLEHGKLFPTCPGIGPMSPRAVFYGRVEMRGKLPRDRRRQPPARLLAITALKRLSRARFLIDSPSYT